MTEIVGNFHNEQCNVKMTYNDEDDIPVPIQKLRRRSSFFAEVRRRSLGNTLLDESCSLQFSTCTKMSNYKDLLEKEENKWRDVMKSRKEEYHEMLRIYDAFCKERYAMTEEEGWSLLEENQRIYFSNLPNFNYIESRCSYNLHLSTLLRNQELTNRIILMKVLERAEDNMDACKAGIKLYATGN